ncbi:phage terminase small subunit [Halorhodospira neutriphila]|uniref:Phage small terminase subunit n=1 Tax=Halorhodospira neutriphila TaxID=168379 RepID=A0ABS1E2K3_9GAMM|nr:phage terminase small subunit [Halorhodospira neutriphila]MBK1725708.1 hypothetical protein [Halorhodospira neutriphila]
MPRNSPARRHYERTLAAASAAARDRQTYADASQYELQLMQLAEHKREIRGVQSFEARAERKRDRLPAYADYVAGVIASGAGVQDEVLMTVMVWRFDVGDIAGGLDIAEYALRHGLVTPDGYKRDTPTLVAEEVADYALRRDPGDVDADLLQRAADATADADMPDEVRAKLHKGLGLALESQGDLEAALSNLRRALELDQSAGVKKAIERVERAASKSADKGADG